MTKTGSKLPPKIDYKETAKLTGKASVKSLLKDAFTKITKVAAMVDVASNMPTSRKKSQKEQDQNAAESYKARYMKKGLSEAQATKAAWKELRTNKANEQKALQKASTAATRGALVGTYTGVSAANKAKAAANKTTAKPKTTANKPMVGPGATSKPSNLITKPAVKTETKTVTPVKSAPTVSQVWKDKTGMSWSEAKNLGLSDGSASSNMRLLKKLQSGEINKDFIAEARAKKDIAFVAPKVTQDEANMEAVPNPSTYRRGGSVKRKRK